MATTKLQNRGVKYQKSLPSILASNSPLYDMMKPLFNPSECFPILMIIFLFAMYVICFTGMYMVNTEMISMGLFFVLHIMFTIFILKTLFFSTSPPGATMDNGSTSKPGIMYILPKVIGEDLEKKFGFIIGTGFGQVRMMTSIVCSTLLVLLTMVITVVAYAKLHSESVESGNPIDFGTQTDMKNQLKAILIAETVMLWVLYMIYSGYSVLIYVLSTYFIRGRGPIGTRLMAEWMVNTANVIVSIGLFVLSAYSSMNVFQMAKNVGAI